MNYRTILMATAAVMFAGAAQAEDFTASWYLPNQGQVLSNTSVRYDRTTLKHFDVASEDLRASEEITYGVTDNFAVVAELGNQFDIEGLTNQEYNNDHNFDYRLGAKYNIEQGNVVAQLGASYYTANPKSWYGHHDNDARWYKEVAANAQLGYKLNNGLTPYTSFDMAGNIDEADRSIEYAWFNGAHYTANKFSLDAGVRYDFNLDQNNSNTWWAQAEANYFVAQNVSLGIYGDYYLGGNGSDEIDYSYSFGLNAKVLF